MTIKEFKADVDQHKKSDFQKAREFYDDFGIYDHELTASLEEMERKNTDDWDNFIKRTTGYVNGFHPEACEDIQFDWDKIEELEDEGYDFPTMPWIPARVERYNEDGSRKSNYTLNRMTYVSRTVYRNIK